MRLLIRSSPDSFSFELGDKDLGIQLAFDEWEDLFYFVLGVPITQIRSNQDIVERYDENKNLFQEWLVEFPKLSRIHDFYEDVYYDFTEVHELLKECSGLVEVCKQRTAGKVLDALIFGCTEAISSGKGLYLLSD